MRKIMMLAMTTSLVALGAIAANAGSPNTLPKSHHAVAGRQVTLRKPASSMREGRAAYVGPWNAYPDYKSVGLSDNPDDCNDGCALSNGS
jgi:hypothetical protein